MAWIDDALAGNDPARERPCTTARSSTRSFNR